MMRFSCIAIAILLASIGMTATAISDSAAQKNCDISAADVVNISYEGVDLSLDLEFSQALMRFKKDKENYFRDATSDGGFIIEGVEYGHLYAKWDTIADYAYKNSTYLALIDNYGWLTKHDDYTWSNDVNYCYIDYRNKSTLPNYFLSHKHLAFAVLILFSLLFFIIVSLFFRDICRDQLAGLVFIFLLLAILAVPSFNLDIQLDFLSLISSGYGRRPLYTILLSLYVVFLFSFHIFFINCNMSLSSVLTCQSFWHNLIERTKKSMILFCRSFWLSTAVFISAPVNKKGKYIIDEMGHMALVEKALGWLLLAIFIATLSNVVVIRSGL